TEAREVIDSTGRSATPPSGGRITAGDCDPNASTSQAQLDINRVRAQVLNAGDMWWNTVDAPRYEVPKQDDPNQPKKHALFAGAVWIGGREQGTGTELVTAQTYRQFGQVSYWPGPINSDGETGDDTCRVWNRHFKVRASQIEDYINLVNSSSDGTVEEDAIPNEIKYWPGRGNIFVLEEFNENLNDPVWQQHLNRSLAPFVDVNGDGAYTPALGDYPRIRGDESIWWVMNDAGNAKNLGEGTGGEPIGLELKVEAFAYSTNDYVDFMTFYEQTLTNKGSKTIVDTYMGQWVDPDLGNFDDDFVGCDVGRGLGICYNGDDFDEGIRGYGENPPSVGVDFFEGPVADLNDGIDNDRDCLVDEGTDGIDNDGDGLIDLDDDDERELIIMSNFVYYNNNRDPVNGNPENLTHYYNYLRSLWKNGARITYDGIAGLTQDEALPSAAFMFPGESDLATGWGLGGNCQAPVTDPSLNYRWDENFVNRGASQNVPADRRFLQSAGPFTLAPGATNRITIGVIWARANGGGATGSFNTLLAADDQAQRLFDRNFEFLDGPNAPDLEIAEYDQALVINIVPDTFSVSFGSPQVSTEEYEEFDNALNGVGAADPFYRFQGYLVYQLRDNTVSPSEVGDPDAARLVLQADIRDGIAQIINFEFDPTVSDEVPRLKVTGADNGLVRSLRITQDLFATNESQLVNYRRYYYTVIAYATNTDPLNRTPYLEGRKNVRIYTAIPHKTEFEEGGLVLRSEYDDGLPVTRQFGVGNSGNVLDLARGEEARILNAPEQSVRELNYEGGSSPIGVRVVNPRKVREGDFNLSLHSLVGYNPATATYNFQPGDTIVSTGIFTDSLLGGFSRPTPIGQVRGEAVVRRIRTDGVPEGLTYLEVDVLNDEVGGRFTLIYDSIADADGEENFIGYSILPKPFIRKGNPAQRAVCSDFGLHDVWQMNNLTTGEVIYSANRVSSQSEQLIREYGIAVRVAESFSPGYLLFQNERFGRNSFQEATLTFA
ncbi:MAG: hypothetical protein WBA12_03945, partial [Catalinimonas sp.]